MTAHRQPRPPRRGIPAAGGVTNPGQAGAPAPEGDSPPARPSDLCECGHVRVLHNLTNTSPKRRTACSVSSGRDATRCECRQFTLAPQTVS